MTWIDLFWKCSADDTYRVANAIQLLSSRLCILHGAIYNACNFEIAGIFTAENVNKLQHFEARSFTFLSINMLTKSIHLPDESNQLAYN